MNFNTLSSKQTCYSHHAILTLFFCVGLTWLFSTQPVAAQSPEPRTAGTISTVTSDAGCIDAGSPSATRAFGPPFSGRDLVPAASCTESGPRALVRVSEATDVPEGSRPARTQDVYPSTSNDSKGEFGKLLYVYREDRTIAVEYRGMLSNRGFTVTIVSLVNLGNEDLTGYDAVIIAHDTGEIGGWPLQVFGFSPTAAAIEASGVPVLGLGEGGYAYFGKIGSNIGWPRGWRRSLRSIEPNETSSVFWQTPNDFGTPPDPLVLYREDNIEIGVYTVDLPDVLMLGREPDDDEHAPIAVQHRDCYMLWGFSAGPAQMTADGKDLFVNAAVFSMGLECDPQVLKDSVFLPVVQG